MENSSKALLIAAAVLIVILLITFAIMVFGSSKNAGDAKSVSEELLAANDKGTDVIREQIDLATTGSSTSSHGQGGLAGGDAIDVSPDIDHQQPGAGGGVPDETNNNSGGGNDAITWTYSDEDHNDGLSVGDIVTASNGESFYVIKTPVSSDTIVKLLAMYNLNATGTAQHPSEEKINNPCAFSNTEYWSSEENFPLDLNNYTVPGDATSIITTAKAYGSSLGGIGRLMAYNEITTVYIPLTYINTWINSQKFWTGTASNNYLVYAVTGTSGVYSGSICRNNNEYGIRPVVEISISSFE